MNARIFAARGGIASRNLAISAFCGNVSAREVTVIQSGQHVQHGRCWPADFHGAFRVQRARSNTANILLMGPRASGKTTVGELFAQKLRRPFVDLDHVTLRSFPDCSGISQAWRAHGEAAWRSAEADALGHVLRSSSQVIALGGGTPTIPAAQAALRVVRDEGRAFVVYLQVDVETLRARLRAARGDRPPLRGNDAVDEVAEILREREPIYLALADLIANGSRPIQDIVATIAAAFDAAKPATPHSHNTE